MTLYGIDISQYQAGESLAEVKKEGFTWVEARCSTGYQGGTPDGAFAAFKKAAHDAGLIFVAYHFLYQNGQVSIAHQADVCAQSIGDSTIPVMIDHEPDGKGAPTPSIADAVNFADAMRARGYHVPLWYLPHWVWSGALKSPALPKSADLSLVASSYVTGKGYASALYPGKANWPAAYGGLEPVIWQFTDAAVVAGKSNDADVFEGTVAELTALLRTGAPDPKPVPKPAAPYYTQDVPVHLVGVSPDRQTALYLGNNGNLQIWQRGHFIRNV